MDINPQPNYPFDFIRADALEVAAMRALWRWSFTLIHASPPCQRYTGGAKQAGTAERHPDFIAPTRELLRMSGLPYAIENVETARAALVAPVMLCGDPMGLGVFRHRLFETSFPVAQPSRPPHTGRIGDGRFVTVAGNPGGSSVRDGWINGRAADWRRAMGTDWMTAKEMAQAIPPAYTRWIGEQFIAQTQPDAA